MKNFCRVAIVDRSFLAHNVYSLLLKPLGYSLFPFKTLKELKENSDWKLGFNLLLVNSNVFNRSFEKHLEWLRQKRDLKALPKVFLCAASERRWKASLQQVPNSHIFVKPFYPPDLEGKIKELMRE